MSSTLDPVGRLSVAVEPCPSGATLTVRANGELDLVTAPVLQRHLADPVREGAVNVVLDVRGLTFCDVAGLNILLRAREQLSAAGGSLSVLGPCGTLQLMVRALDLGHHLPIQLQE